MKENAGIFFLIALFLAVGLLRLNDISLYTPDSTLYVIWGNSVAHGHGFVDNTKPDADRYIINAPLYALLIAPVEVFFPFSLIAVKIWTLLWGCGALLLFYIWLKKLFGRNYALGGAILLAFNPMTIVFSTEALSEAPFLVMLLSILLVIEKMTEVRDIGNPKGSISFLETLIFFLCIATISLLREIGAAVVVAAILYLLVRRRMKYALFVVVAAGIFFAAWYVRNNIIVGVPQGGRGGNLKLIVQHFATDSSASLASELFYRFIGNAKTYCSQIGGTLFYSLFSNKQMNLIVNPTKLHLFLMDLFSNTKYLILVIASPLMIAGMVADFRTHAAAIFRLLVVLGLFAVIMIYPIYDIRFLTPWLVFMIYYALSGLRWLLELYGKERFRENLLVPLAILFMLPNVSAIAEIIGTNIAFERDPVALAKNTDSLPVVFIWPWSTMGSWIQKNTDANAIVACPIKELARVVGGRKMLELEPNITEPVFEASIREFNVSYILAAVRWGNFSTYEFDMLESDRYRFTPVYRAGGLTLYKVVSRLQNDVPPGQPFTLAEDSVTSTGLLRAGRAIYRKGDYSGAARMYKRAHELTPEMEEPLYQLVIASVMMRDSSSARIYFQKLLSLPQTLSHSLLASDLMHALDLEAEAASMPLVQRHALLSLDAALKYWNNGYYQRATSITDSMLVRSDNFFMGLLWGTHFNLQEGDTLRAREYFRKAWTIDSGNAITRAFRRVFEIGDSLEGESNAQERSRMHLEIGMLYRKIDLPLVDLDEDERALKENPTNLQAILFKAKTLEDIGRLSTAESFYTQALNLNPTDADIATKLKSLQLRTRQ